MSIAREWAWRAWTGALMLAVAWIAYRDNNHPPRICPANTLPIAAPSAGPVSVEWTHGDGRVTVNLGGTGYPIVADPGSGKRWILLPVKTEPGE